MTAAIDFTPIKIDKLPEIRHLTCLEAPDFPRRLHKD